MNTLQIRIDEKTKRKAQKVLYRLGLDMSSAIKIYLHQIIEHQAIPFFVTTKNDFAQKKEQGPLRSSKKAKGGK